MSKKNLEQWLSFLESNHPTEIDMGLDRVRTVAQRLGLIKPTPLVLLVAGTNGKGSTVTITGRVLQESGMSVGSYMSPHLHQYNERVRINGEPVSDDDIIESFEAIDEARADISLTYFEVGTLSALYIFKKHQLDVSVLEIGLGGRLDAVNIVDADGAAVTSIGLDHQDWLGDDITQIAYEKAGVYRSVKPAICGQRNPPASLANHADSISAPLLIKGRDFDFVVNDQDWLWHGKSTDGQTITLDQLFLPSLPIENAATALQLLIQIKPELTLNQINAGLKAACLPGRLQAFTSPFNGIIDVGHNAQAAQLLNAELTRQVNKGKTIGLLAMLADKDAASVVSEMSEIDQWIICGISGYRGQTSSELLGKVNLNAESTKSFESVPFALEYLAENVDESDRVVIFGSFVTAAQAQTWLAEHQG